MKLWIWLIILIMFLVAVLIIGSLYNPAMNPKNARAGIINGKVANYGNNVYYFNSESADFASGLSAFIGEHSELEVVSICGDGTGAYGSDVGYFVVFRNK